MKLNMTAVLGVALACTLTHSAAQAQSSWFGAEKNSVYDKQSVSFSKKYRPGEIIVSFSDRRLYHVTARGQAMSYPIAVPRAQSRWQGTQRVTRKKVNPSWTPTASMIERNPEYAEFADGMEPGPTNALGSRALYLYVGNRDTYLRIHGTPQPRSIGGRASSGCVRMVMAHINDLYPNVAVGSTAYLYSAEQSVVSGS